MSVLFNDARFNVRARRRSRWSTGLWLSVGVHTTLAGVLLGVVPTRASEKPSPRPPSMAVRATAIADVPKPAAVIPIAARPVEPPPATLLSAPPSFERPVEARPVETRAPERPPETGLFERSNGPQTGQPAGTVATGRFGTVASTPRGAVKEADVKSAEFDRRANVPAQSSGVAAPKPIDRPVEIVFKPSPEYTDEARSARIEGTVTLELEFTAAGDVHVLRVVRGLGHGLDEAAERAALRIRFKPARSSDGQAVDSRATVHITFRLS
jgi:TonB family protein